MPHTYLVKKASFINCPHYRQAYFQGLESNLINMWILLIFSLVFSNPIESKFTSIFNRLYVLVSGSQQQAFSMFSHLDTVNEADSASSEIIYMANMTMTQEIVLHYFKVAELKGSIEVQAHSSPCFEEMKNMTVEKIRNKKGIGLNEEALLVSVKEQKINEMNGEYEVIEIVYETEGNIRKQYTVLKKNMKLNTFEWMITDNQLKSKIRTGPSPLLCFLLTVLLTTAITYTYYFKFKQLPCIKLAEDEIKIANPQ